MTPPHPLHPGERLSPRPFRTRTPWPGHPPYPSPGLPHRQPSRPFPSPGRRFQKRPMTRRTQPDRLSGSMTVCIAAIASGAIVAVNDMMLANETGATELADVKNTWLVDDDDRGTSWFCLYSGDPTLFQVLTWHIQAAVGHSPAVSLAGMKSAVENAYDALICRQIEREVLSQRYGVSYAQFSNMGQKKSGSAAFTAITKDVAEARREIINEMLYGLNGTMPTSLLVCGFDQVLEPHIFSTNAIGRCAIGDSLGYDAVGIGAEAARAWLLAKQDFPKRLPVHDTIYHLCEAKFLAENSPYVGKTTLVNVWLRDHTVLPLFVPAPNAKGSLQIVRSAWLEQVGRPVATEVSLKIKAELESHVQIYKETRPIGSALDPGTALSRLNATAKGFEESVVALRDTPRDQYSDDVFSELRFGLHEAQEREPELRALISEWKASGVKPSELASVANKFEFALVVLRNYRYKTIRKPDGEAKPLE